MSELSSNSDGIQEEVAESSNTKQSKINLKQQLGPVRLQKKIEFNKYQSQQREKISKMPIPKNLNYYERFDFKWLLWMISITMYIQSFGKKRNISLST